MHDLRQQRCPMVTPTLLGLKFVAVRDTSLVPLSIGMQNRHKK
jgi:hypothetical protein